MAEFKPKFRPDIRRHAFGEAHGGQSIVLEDPVANKFFRLSSYEFDLLRVLDGTVTVEEAVEKLRLYGRYYTIEHASKLLEQFSRVGLLLGTAHGYSANQMRLKASLEEARRKRSLFRIYFLFIPLVNPDEFLSRTLWLWRMAVNPVTALIPIILAPAAIYLLISGLMRFQTEYLFFFNVRNLAVLWIAIALVKLIHEFSHAYTAKSLGLHVPEMGVGFLLFFPVLYCNTTAAWQLADRRQRMWISAAGVFSEACIAVFSVFVWYFTNPGIVNSVAFYLMAISLLTSILFNANPLMKFDGYFVLADWLRIPNLQSRSFGLLRYLFWNRVLGVESFRARRNRGKEFSILLVYGIAAFIYRIFLYAGIVIGIYYRFDKTLGIMLGCLAFTLFVVRPLVGGMSGLWKRRSEMSFRPYGLAVFAAFLVSAGVLVTIPWSRNSVYPCYIDSTMVRKIVIPVEAPVGNVYARKGERVREGTTILSLDSTRLEYELRDKKLEKSLLSEEIAIIEASGNDLARIPLKRIELSQTSDALKEIREDMSRLEWKAPFNGVITDLATNLQPGARLEKGTVVGELTGEEQCEVIGLVPEHEIGKVREGTAVEIWFPIGTGTSFSATVKEISVFHREDLADSPFSSRFGGEIATAQRSPEYKDVPLEAYYMCRVDFPNQVGIPLGMTGRIAVPEPARSILRRVVETVYKTFRREIIF
ncbi:MAG: efflux RND transporter periplasmic adaptor subunit [Desulfomonilaceae bacterium]|nr:efflux RND transporter periplasmic adaptor subunit [Desulfomonilaceae bacterium]